ncbi:MAG: translocation/assembly module TamB domain-containing protein, partial [Duncaniella sp.]|nr:translocation/assembly module TamB domain-containing protein [Duncaniella sp.]
MADSPGLHADIDFHPTQLVFNDSAWTVNPGHIGIAPNRVEITDFGGGRAGQSLSINGVASADSTDRVVISLNSIDLDYIFETLNIGEAVMFGGRATGDFYGSALLSKEPVLYTPRLSVESLKYNFCEMGDGDIKSYWDNNSKSIGIDAVISQRNGEKSLIHGFIRPFSEELDFDFNANKAPVGFMLPFMAAFTSKISGDVTGSAHLFGTFKDLDMTGDIYLNDLSMKLDFTNTTYTTSSAVHISPGEIKFSDVELKDMYGNTAQLDGYVSHEYFHNPSFQFRVTKAKDLLVYNVDESTSENPWYGKIFGNGSATVTGVPGKVDIGVTMTTAPKSTFTFVLSDTENAMEYDFITLRDRDAAKKDSIAALTAPPLIVRQLKERIRKEEIHPSLYAMEFNVDITPAATMNLIMDPVGGCLLSTS